MALFFFFLQGKKKNQKQGLDANPNLSRHQSCRTTSNKNKKTKERMQNIAFRTNLHHVILLSFPSSAFRPVRGGEKKGQRLRFNPPRFHFSCNNKMYSKRGFFFFSLLVLRRRKAKNWRLKREKSKRREQPVVRESVIIIEVEGSGRNGFTVIFGLRVSQSDVTLDLRAAQKRPIFFYFLFSFSPPFSGSFHA